MQQNGSFSMLGKRKYTILKIFDREGGGVIGQRGRSLICTTDLLEERR